MPQDTKDQTAPKTMLSFAPAPAPIFTANWDHHRPAVSSPLSSSPLRASSPPGTQDGGAGIFSMRQTQSSPIPAPRFKYASRPTRPNPVLRRREDAQEQRRSNFLRSVRDKAEDKAWQRRDIEGQFLKTNFIADMDRLSHDAPEISEADIEDASSFEPEGMEYEDDAVMEAHTEEDELESMLASYMQHQPQSPVVRPVSPSLSDDEYDDIFEELLSAKDIDQAMQTQQASSTEDMDME